MGRCRIRRGEETRGDETRREGSGSEVCGAPCACSAMYAMEEGRRGTASVSLMCAATVVIAEKRGSEGKAKKSSGENHPK